MGLTRDESSRYQQLAAMPAEHFETAVATAKATAGEVTTAFMLREAAREPLKQLLDAEKNARRLFATAFRTLWVAAHLTGIQPSG